MLRFRSEHDHDLGGIERCENVRLVSSAEFIFQRNPSEEDLEALLFQLVIKIIGKHAVRRSATIVIRFLVADKNVERFLFLRNGEDALLNIVDRLCFFYVELALISVSVLNSGFVVIVVEDRGELSAVDRRHAFMRRGVLHVFNTVLTEYERPVRFRISRVLRQNLLVYRRSFIKFVIPTEMVGTVVKIRPSVIVQTRQSLFRSAVVAYTYGRSLLKFYCAAAHFTFEDRHILYSSYHSLQKAKRHFCNSTKGKARYNGNQRFFPGTH